MIHYHGLRITPETAALTAIDAGHACVRFGDHGQLDLAVTVCQSIMLDNGAFPAWTDGNPITDWQPFYDWAAECKFLPLCDFAIIPDVIDGDERANDALLEAWPLPAHFGAPVWHLHESLDRLRDLVNAWPRVCLGSSGELVEVPKRAA